MDVFDYKAYGEHIAVSVTNACPLTCAHCVSSSSPYTEVGSECLPSALGVLLARTPRIRHVTLTGGEPFKDTARLAEFVKQCSIHRVRVGVITSGFWAKSRTQARKTLEPLIYLSTITISTDIYHTEFVPIRFLENAFAAAKDLQVRPHIRFTRHNEMSPGEQNLLNELRRFCCEEEIEQALLAPYGRASDMNLFQTVETIFGKCPAAGPHIYQNGRAIACCSGIVDLADTRHFEFGNILTENPYDVWKRANENYYLLAIKILGFDYIIERLVALAPDLKPRLSASNVCGLCYKFCTDNELENALQRLFRSEDFLLTLHAVALSEFGVECSGEWLAEWARKSISV